MKAQIFVGLACAAIATSTLAPARADSPNSTSTVDLKQAVPADAFLAIYARHNPQRDYQRAYFADVWKTIQDEQIGQRLLNIVTSRMPEDKLTTAKGKFQELKTALEPINFQSLINADEVVVAERMEGPFNNVLWAARLNSDDAADCERGAVQAFELLARWSEGKITVHASQLKDATITGLVFPKKSPFQPAVARLNDIVLVSTNVGLLSSSVEQLQSKSAKSKFDDPRLQAALAELHKPDDSLVFFDAQQMFQSFHEIGDFIRSQANNDAKALRAASLLDRIADETAILDYVVTVEYTEPGHTHSVSLIKMADKYDTKLLGRAVAKDKSIENWQSWVPKDATAFSIHRGLDLHELYVGIVKFVREQFPESQAALDKFTEFQVKIGVNLDRDILQSFSGESVCVTMPLGPVEKEHF
jgi:hypothetical protein